MGWRSRRIPWRECGGDLPPAPVPRASRSRNGCAASGHPISSPLSRHTNFERGRFVLRETWDGVRGVPTSERQITVRAESVTTEVVRGKRAWDRQVVGPDRHYVFPHVGIRPGGEEARRDVAFRRSPVERAAPAAPCGRGGDGSQGLARGGDAASASGETGTGSSRIRDRRGVLTAEGCTTCSPARIVRTAVRRHSTCRSHDGDGPGATPREGATSARG